MKKRPDRTRRLIKIILTREPSGWWLAAAPVLYSARTQGRTRASARTMLISLIADLLALYRDEGREPPFEPPMPVSGPFRSVGRSRRGPWLVIEPVARCRSRKT